MPEKDPSEASRSLLGSKFDPTSYVEAVRSYLVETDKLIEHISEFDWTEDAGFLQLVFRAVLRRQHEALRAILDLAESGRGDAAVPLLRPACEEYIVAKYLVSLDREQGERLVVALAQVEANDDLVAQRQYAGDSAMRELGFSVRFIKQTHQAAEVARESLARLGDELGWGGRRGRFPSIRSIARLTNTLELYDFLYHATSRFVHFKVKELLRRAWGKPPRMSVTSDHFGTHWTAFALYWGLWLHVNTVPELFDALDPMPDKDDLVSQRLVEALRTVGPAIPLVTAEEFLWEGNRPPWE